MNGAPGGQLYALVRWRTDLEGFAEAALSPPFDITSLSGGKKGLWVFYPCERFDTVFIVRSLTVALWVVLAYWTVERSIAALRAAL